MSRLVAEAFISLIEFPEERRSGYDRRQKDIGSMEEKRRGEDRRSDFLPKDMPHYIREHLRGVFDEFMRDHDRYFPVVIKTDGERVTCGPLRIINDWLGWDLTKVSLEAIYVDPESRLRVLEHVTEGEFTRFFPHILKADGQTIVLDVLITVLTTREGEREYLCFIDMADD